MKRHYHTVIIFMFLSLFLLSSCSGTGYFCPSCGANVSHLVECPVCYAKVCELCADDDGYLEEIYAAGVMVEYLRDRGYVVFSEQQEAYNLYGYGFISGYLKGTAGIHDDEVSEFVDGYDYERLDEIYGEFSF